MCATQASSYKTRCLSPYMRILVPDLIERTISKLLKRYLDFSKLLDCRAPLGVKLTRCHPNTVVYLVPNIYLSLSHFIFSIFQTVCSTSFSNFRCLSPAPSSLWERCPAKHIRICSSCPTSQLPFVTSLVVYFLKEINQSICRTACTEGIWTCLNQ